MWRTKRPKVEGILLEIRKDQTDFSHSYHAYYQGTRREMIGVLNEDQYVKLTAVLDKLDKRVISVVGTNNAQVTQLYYRFKPTRQRRFRPFCQMELPDVDLYSKS